MGEGEDANEYDEDKVRPGERPFIADLQIFYHLVFYIDSPQNAQTNGLADSDPPQATLDRFVVLGLLLKR